jgi:hypothetical protein
MYVLGSGIIVRCNSPFCCSRTIVQTLLVFIRMALTCFVIFRDIL